MLITGCYSCVQLGIRDSLSSIAGEDLKIIKIRIMIIFKLIRVNFLRSSFPHSESTLFYYVFSFFDATLAGQESKISCCSHRYRRGTHFNLRDEVRGISEQLYLRIAQSIQLVST